MNIVEYREDRVWESVLETLAAGGRLGRLYKLTKNELAVVIKLNEQVVLNDLGRVYHLTQVGDSDLRKDFIDQVGENRIYAMLHSLLKCMKCWVESESAIQTVRSRWKIAHS